MELFKFTFQFSFGNNLTIFEQALIEFVRRELSNLGVHTVLYFKHVFFLTFVYSLKKTVIVKGSVFVLGEKSSWQLFWVTYKNNVFWVEVERE